MNNAITTINNVHNPEIRLDSEAARTGQALRIHSASRVACALETAGNSVKRPLFEPHKDRQVREDKEFYIPDLLSDAEYDANSEAYSAFAQQARDLYKAEGLLDDAWNLVGLLLASIGDEGDSRAMQAEAGLKVIENKLSKAHAQIDRHRSRYTNLFLAYFELKEKTESGAE